MARIDQVWSGKSRTYGRWVRNFRREERYNFAGEHERRAVDARIDRSVQLQPGRRAHRDALAVDRARREGQLAAIQRRPDALRAVRSGHAGLLADPTLALFRGYQFIPRFSIESGNPTGAGTVATLGGQQGGFNMGRQQPFYNIQFAPTLTMTRGTHTIKAGYDLRRLRQDETSAGWQGGAFAFDSTYTRSASNVAGPLRPGHRRVHARPADQRVVHRDAPERSRSPSTATASSCTTTGACRHASR